MVLFRSVICGGVLLRAYHNSEDFPISEYFVLFVTKFGVRLNVKTSHVTLNSRESFNVFVHVTYRNVVTRK
jgi:hypothetical protein